MNKWKFLYDSPTLKSSLLATNIIKGGGKIISLGLGEMWYETPTEINQAAIKGLMSGMTRYSHFMGLESLRRAIVENFNNSSQFTLSEDNVVITNGAKGALFLVLLAILEAGDQVVIISPSYVSYEPQIRLVSDRCKVIKIRLKAKDYSIDWQALEKTLKLNPKVVILNFPHNPTGKMLSKNEVNRLIHCLNNFHGFIISDEVYEDLIYESENRNNLLSYQIELKDKIIKISSFSKAYCMTGWRVGYLLTSNNKIVENIGKIQQHVQTNVCTFIQKGAEAVFGLDKNWLINYIDELMEKKCFLVQKIGKTKKLTLIPPEAGLFSMINIEKTGIHSDQFVTDLLKKTGVMVNPGVIFGKEWDGFIRVSMGARPNDFTEGVYRLVEYVSGLK